jgi:rare lipoprotein A
MPATVATPVLTAAASGLHLQLGAFANVGNAQQFRDRVARELPWLREPPAIVAQAGLHRVRVGPYPTRQEAQAVADRIQFELAVTPLLTPSKP